MGHAALHPRKTEGTRARRVWQIADELAAERGAPPGQPAVVARFTAEGGNANTAKTEYVNWLRAYKRQAGGAGFAEDAPLWQREPGNVDNQRLTVAPDGRLLIPAAMRQAMLLDGDGRVTARIVDGELRVISPVAALRQAQEMLRPYITGDTLLSDELLADRRAEVERERRR